MNEEPLTLIHLSDIHFRHKISGTSIDIDKGLRNELERDALEMRSRLGNVLGMLVTGDIAFSGHNDEYEETKKWLSNLSSILNCTSENIWTVPGNHDVNRSEIDRSETIKSLHAELRSFRKTQYIDQEIQKKFFFDTEAKELLFRPLQNYMKFNARFEGDIKQLNPLYWEYDLKLNDGSLLRLRGLNSTLISDNSDDNESNKLFLGTLQVDLKNEEGVEYLTLCHHPPDWLVDKDNVESYLNKRAKIQLYGHKHNQNISRIGDSVRITAGATHPSRTEDVWLPRYNFLAISVSKEDNIRKLNVRVYPRIWSDEEKIFKGDFDSPGSDERVFVFNLSNWEPLNEDQVTTGEMTINTADESVENKHTTNDVKIMQYNVNPSRRLTYRFLSLPYNVRLQIALELDLILDEDEGLHEAELFKKVFRRAKKEKKLGELWEKVEKKHGDTDDTNNPFKNS